MVVAATRLCDSQQLPERRLCALCHITRNWKHVSRQKVHFSNSVLFSVKQSLMTKTDENLFAWIYCHLWSNSFYLAVSHSMKYFLQILCLTVVFFFFSCYPSIFDFCPIPASPAKINTPAAWKLWIPLFWICSCRLWTTIHLLSLCLIFQNHFLHILAELFSWIFPSFHPFATFLSAPCLYSACTPFSTPDPFLFFLFLLVAPFLA